MRMNCNFSSKVELKQLLKILNSKFAVYKPMNKIAILALGAVFAVSMIAITAFEVEGAPPSKVACPAENVQHWGSFKVSPSAGAITHPTLPSIVSVTFLEAQVPSDQAYVDKEVVLARLIELGYLDATGGTLELSEFSAGAQQNTSIICAQN